MRLPLPIKKKARLEIIPMIDTIFFLLVFFMMATLSMTIQQGLPVNLPQAVSAHEHISEVVSLTVTADGKLFYNKEEVPSTSEIQHRLLRSDPSKPKPSVVVNADKSVEHGRVVEVMDAVRQAGITKMAIATKPKG